MLFNGSTMAVTRFGEQIIQMTTNSNKAAQPGRRSPWFQIGRFLFLVALAVAFFLLAQSMVRHRFHRGGWFDQNQTLRP
jgi:hypothetical protein